MENVFLFSSDMYEVEKIINCKYYKNKKYYLIKWLCYPINQSTWEPKSNLKNLKYLIDEFEAEYPYTIDHNMYNIFCDEAKKRKKLKKKVKNNYYSNSNMKLISRKRNNDYFSDDELRVLNLDGLKTHLHIKKNKSQKKDKKQQKDDLIIDLRLEEDTNEENSIKSIEKEENKKEFEEKVQNFPKLIMPILL